jgi:arabinogalactan oligomer / maltooligosaccharide transport system permease protein
MRTRRFLVAASAGASFSPAPAGSLILAIPTVLLFQFLQRYIVDGLTAGAVKG